MRRIALSRVIDAVRRHRTTLDDPGFCLNCGIECDGCEPDAERYRCDNCGARAVYGAESLLIRYA